MDLEEEWAPEKDALQSTSSVSENRGFGLVASGEDQ